MRRFSTHKRLTVLSMVAVLAIAGAATAYWTGLGSGTGTANVGTSGTVTLTATVPAGIAPGTSKDLSFTAANPSTSAVYVSTVHLESVTPDSAHSACTTADFSMADVSEGVEVAAGATAQSLPTGGTLAYANTASNQDPCKGATLTLTLSSS
jgi:hypothetical protein